MENLKFDKEITALLGSAAPQGERHAAVPGFRDQDCAFLATSSASAAPQSI